ncbi:Small subunit (SSU) processome component [Ascosphaera acerosa]|nr:Small subunit (SSU) processome component [Ascosphaera acerosa]
MPSTTIATMSTPTPTTLQPTADSTEMTPPSTSASLSAVLSQALRTNDAALLESCFHTTDAATVRATIQRIDSSLAAALLARLAERLAQRPGRHGPLLVWLQWTCVAHGGSVAAAAGAARQLADVFRVMDERSAVLAPLLLLKGKLDLLDAQLGLRRAGRVGSTAGGYILGTTDDESAGEEEARQAAIAFASTPAGKGAKRKQLGAATAGPKRRRTQSGLRDAELEMFSDAEGVGEQGAEEESDDAHMPLTVDDPDTEDSGNEESSDEEEGEEEGFFDEEAEVSDDEGDGDEGEDDDEKEEEEEEEEEGNGEGSDMDGFINDDASEGAEESDDEEGVEMAAAAAPAATPKPRRSRKGGR